MPVQRGSRTRLLDLDSQGVRNGGIFSSPSESATSPATVQAEQRNKRRDERQRDHQGSQGG